MTYAHEYGAAIERGPVMKYSLRTHQDTAPFIDNLLREYRKGGFILSDKKRREWADSHYGVLADYLDDEGDPRGLMLRKTIGNETPFKPTDSQFSHFVPGPDGGYLSVHYVTEIDRPFLFGTMRMVGTEPRNFFYRTARLTPDDVREIADRLPEEHATTLHHFLDKHFGPREHG